MVAAAQSWMKIQVLDETFLIWQDKVKDVCSISMSESC